MCFSHFTEATPYPVGHDEPEGRAVVGAGEADLDALRGRLGLLQHLVQEGTGPPSRGDSVVTPWFAGRQRSHR
jgi:hypothetical protein